MKAQTARPWFLRHLQLQDSTACSNALHTARMALRPLRYRDARDFYLYAKDPQVAQYVLWDAHTSLSQTRSILRGQISRNRKENLLTMAMTLKENDRMVGTIGLVWRDWQNLSAEVGFSLAADCWGRGLMTEALIAYLRFAFTQQNIHRIEAQHDVLNPASGAVMRKAGMREEGLLQERIYYKGRHASVILFAAIRETWLGEH
jgi:ribosomal-protein-alanine N-acetyltransferase